MDNIPRVTDTSTTISAEDEIAHDEAICFIQAQIAEQLQHPEADSYSNDNSTATLMLPRTRSPSIAQPPREYEEVAQY